MATTSARALALLSLLSSGAIMGAASLAARLEVGERTIRRDVDTLRQLGYDVRPVKGAGGGYRMRGGTRLPPLVFDEDQVIAVAVALQTAPSVLAGIRDSSARALETVRQVMPDRLRVESDAFTVTAVANYWDFPGTPIDARVVKSVGAAVRRRHVMRVDYSAGDGAVSRMRLEPHQMIVWAARWYVIAFDLERAEWRALRLDRLQVGDPTFVPFGDRPIPGASAEAFVKRTFDRGDSLAGWPCQGSVVLDVPPHVAAEFVPGGAVVEYVSDTRSRLLMGAWSWVGLAGLFITFAAEMAEIEPIELRDAFDSVRARLGRSGRESGS